MTTLLRNVTLTAVVWVLVGVPSAVLICATSLLWFALLAVPRMAEVAVALGTIDGILLHLLFKGSNAPKILRRTGGALLGAFLGLLAFPPVYFDTELVAQSEIPIVTFIAAGAAAGALCGWLSAIVVRIEPSTRSLRPATRILATAALLGAAVCIDYTLFWEQTSERLPAPEITPQTVASIETGTGKGTAFSGCYDYWGHWSFNAGSEAGLLKISQSDGRVTALSPDLRRVIRMHGAIGRYGGFTFGGEDKDPQGDVMRYLWRGKRNENGFKFERFATVIMRAGDKHSSRLRGFAQKIDCARWEQALHRAGP